MENLIQKYTLSQDLLDQEVSEEHLQVSRIIEDHEIVGPELGLSSQEMTAVCSNVNKQELQKLAMLKRWHQIYVWNVMYGELIIALVKLLAEGKYTL